MKVVSSLFGDVPLQLINIDSDGKLSVVESTLTLISELDSEKGLGAVVVAGPYHKGKSYLLNRIARTKNGFTVGLHTEAETKGLWVLARRIGGMTVLLIDSEGIDAPGNRATIDSRIFALGMLLSSVFIYNTMSLIEENSLRHLSFVTSLAAHINPDAEQHASITFPRLLWLVRDFSYWKDLERKHGNSATQYMESVLSVSLLTSSMTLDESGSGIKQSSGSVARPEDDNDNSNIREGLSKLFPTERRSCYLLPIPALETEDLVNMDEAEINKKFIAKMQHLVNEELPSLISPKMRGTHILTGKDYATLVEMCANAMNEEVEEVTLFIPNIRSKFALNEAEDLYDKGMEFEAKNFPLKNEEMAKIHKARMKSAIAHFSAKAYGPTKEVLATDLQHRLEDKFKSFMSRNRELRDRSFLGFGSLQNAVVAGAIFFLLLALVDVATALLLIGAVVTVYYAGHFYTLTNRIATYLTLFLDKWNAHGRPWADQHPQAMVALIVAITLVLWWFS